MSLDPNLADTNPTAGEDAGSQPADTQDTQPAPAAPAERTYKDSDMAAARRSWEQRAARDREIAIQQARAEWQRSQTPPANPDDPWSKFDPDVAKALQAALERAIETRAAPLQARVDSYAKQQEDLAFANDESRMSAKYPDYQKNRIPVIEFAVASGIKNLDLAYHAWRSQNQWPDEKAIRLDERGKYGKAKVAQSSTAPLTEGRGGGSPSTKTNFRDKDGKLDKDAMDAAALEIIHSASQ